MKMDAKSAVEAVFREESGRIAATLILSCGSFDAAEEALQEALASALVAWPEKGIPQNPAAWITSVARRKLIDLSRHEKMKAGKQGSLRYEIEGASRFDGLWDEEMDTHVADDRLRLIFTCCHPALNQEAQIALTLRTLCGLTTPEIAKAFLAPEPTVAQRLVRAKRKIKDAGIPYQVPPAHELPGRLASVQAVIYLVFNEGYAAATGDHLVRTDLCNEAIRLARVLSELLPGDSESLGLLALMLLQHSRRDARVMGGRLVTLEEQDRSLWDRAGIAEGLKLVDAALAWGRPGPYQVQAAIAALHAQAETPEGTDWRQIRALYRRLLGMTDSPVVALNHAVAIAMGGELAEGLERIEELGGLLEGYYLFHAARADILRRMNRREEAVECYRRALALATNGLERDFLTRRIEETQRQQ